MNHPRQIKKQIAVCVAFILAFIPIAANADGVLMPPPNSLMYESDQRAVLLYEPATQTETLVLSMKFLGNAEQSAWIIPVPSMPTISKGSDELFSAVAELTQGQYYSYTRLGNAAYEGSGDYERSVQIIQTQRVDYYQITTLSSTDSQSLGAWLTANGYQYPASAAYLFDSYIANGWYFVAAKLDTSSLPYVDRNLKTREGHMTPLKLSFQTKNMVFPLRVSSAATAFTADRPESVANVNAATGANINAAMGSQAYPSTSFRPTSVDIELYILASHKKFLPGFTTVYANWVKKKDIERWAVDDQGESLLKPSAEKYFLTKLTRSMTYQQMTDDLFPRDAANNKKVGVKGEWHAAASEVLLSLLAVSVYTILVFGIAILSPFGIAFILFSIVWRKTRSSGWRITAWIVQIGTTALYAILGFLVILVMSSSGSGLLSFPSSIMSLSGGGSRESSAAWLLTIALPIGAMLAAQVFVMISQVRRFKKGSSGANLP